jgi:hypothetical protein
MSLPDNGWTEQQAQGLLECLNLDGGTPKWKREHLQRLRAWCSAHGKDPATADGQLEFVADDLCNTYEGVVWLSSELPLSERQERQSPPYMNG